MPTSIFMPSLSPTMEEGVVAKWLVKEGDFVKSGTMLCSVETDKTTVDYECLDEGYFRKMVVPGGGAAKVNQLIAIFGDEKDENIDVFLKAELEKNQTLLGKANKSAPNSVAASAPAPAPTTAAIFAPAPLLTPEPVVPAAEHANGDERLRVSPLARKIAAEAGILLDDLQGSGPSGRIIRRDVDAQIANPSKAKSATAKPGSGKAEGPVSLPVFGSLAPVAKTQDIVLNMMRKTIGKRLLESAQSLPVFYVTMKMDMGPVEALRAQLNRAPGYKVSVNDILIKAVAFTLRQHPKVNASFYGDFIREHAEIDISVAVSVEGGLITPIVRSADLKGLGHISAEVKQLVGKAKAGKLAPEEFQGGTFTISNMGMYGVDSFTSIINLPQAAILAVGAIQPELYLDENGVAKQKNIMKVTLSADHRVIDGALAAQFVHSLKSMIENPTWLLL